MRVAFAYRNLNRRGSLERGSMFLLEGLVRRGVEVHCYCDPHTRDVDLPGVAFHDVAALVRSRSRFGYAVERATFAARATRLLRRHRARYDLVHSLGVAAWEHDVVSVPAVSKADHRRWPRSGGRGYRFARTRAKLVPILRPEAGVVRTIERLQFRPGRYLRLTAVTPSVRDDLVAVHGVPAELIDVVPPPAEVDRFAAARDGDLRSRLGVAPESELALFIGNEFERKGLGDAVAALPALSPWVHLVVVGAGDRSAYAAQAEKLGVAGRVHFVGPTDEPERFVAGADLLVLPTRHEPFGIPIVEAMAAGVPVVTTDVAGAGRAAAEAGAGLLVPLRSPQALAEAIRRILGEPDRRRAMAERGRRAAEAYGVEAFVDRIMATYERALVTKGTV